jgi:hypothetical protein
VDHFYENDGTILDMYSENPNATDPNYWQTQHKDVGIIQLKEIAIIESISYRNQHLTQRPNGFWCAFYHTNWRKSNGQIRMELWVQQHGRL